MNPWRYVIAALYMLSSCVFAEVNFESPFNQAQQNFRQGQYYLTLDDLKTSQQRASTVEQKAKSIGLLGLTHYRMHHYQQAESYLQEAIQTQAGDKSTRAQWHIALAALNGSQNQLDSARQHYSEALKLAENNPDLQFSIQLGQVQLKPDNLRLAELQSIYKNINSLNPPDARIPHLINIAVQTRSMRNSATSASHSEPRTSSETAGLKLAYESLDQAKQLNNAKNPRLTAEILDEQAQLYEEQHRTDEALYLNTQGLQVARSVQADDLLLNLEWRQGRILKTKQKLPEAIAAYERAVAHIETIRQDIPVEYHDGRSSFRETLEPVYLGLADLLLQQANSASDAQQAQLLRHARDTVELIKQNELADFLGGRCAVSGANLANVDKIGSGTAVIYPIILPDRLEILISIDTELAHFSKVITADNLQGLVLNFAHSLRFGTEKAEPASRELYQVLIAPLQALLRQKQIHTLVWVPDGILRLIPPSALYDGEHYLIENYAIATSPGLTLFDPASATQNETKALLAGISEPGPVLEHLPSKWLRDLTESNQRGGNLQSKSRALPNLEKALALSLPQPSVSNPPIESSQRQSLKKLLSLPGVAQEMQSLQKGIDNTMLLNETFTVANFKQQLLQQPYSMIHIASHGVFGNTADTSFVMAFDDLLTMSQLEQLLKSDKFTKQPVELLTLSACQTAEGDDRAPLGISGIAIKAKVKSALGSLWPVDDAAASELMTAFYQNLAKGKFNKAQALQQAQLKLLKQPALNHPYFWSPFILVGNWL